jgi:phosphotransferase system enzyme I (PtsI)
VSKQIISGIPVSSGIAIGKAFFMNRRLSGRIPRQAIAETDVPAEIARLQKAFDLAADELSAMRKKVPAELREHALIIDTHLTIIRDPKLIKAAERYITEMHINAEWALYKAVREIRQAFEAVEDEYIRERIQDVRLLAERLTSKLLGSAEPLKAIESRVILMAHDLSPADTVGLDVKKIMAFATTMGAKTSHTGILARSLRIPAVVGVGELEEIIEDGQFVILDALSGKVIIEPDEEELAAYADRKYQFENYQKSILKECQLPGETRDGYRVQVMANIEFHDEVGDVLELGGEGVGLYRTEYSYLGREDLPLEEELYREYRGMAETMGHRRVVFRTLDLGSDKFLAHFGLEESNPALGLRSIRFCLEHRDMFKTQLRAMLRAGLYGNAAMMYPMISGLQELESANEVLNETKGELEAEGVEHNPDMPLGLMIELPSAVMIAELLARRVDFFSIGTNDLIQYSLGIDRGNKYVSHLYQPLHPAVVRSIKHTVDAAHQTGIEVSLCGEVAADPYCVPILLGMQVDSLSMNPQAIPGIKRIIRQTTMDQCKDLLSQVLKSDNVNVVNRLVKDSIFRQFPEELTFYSSLLDVEEV